MRTKKRVSVLKRSPADAEGGTRTPTTIGHCHLKTARLPIPPLPQDSRYIPERIEVIRGRCGGVNVEKANDRWLRFSGSFHRGVGHERQTIARHAGLSYNRSQRIHLP